MSSRDTIWYWKWFHLYKEFNDGMVHFEFGAYRHYRQAWINITLWNYRKKMKDK